MGTAANIMILVFCASFMLFVLGVTDNSTYGSPYKYLSAQFQTNLTNDANSVANTNSSTLAGTLTFPNAFSFFANTFLALISFITIPLWFFGNNGLGEAGVFIGTLFIALFAIAILSWLKGGGEP